MNPQIVIALVEIAISLAQNLGHGSVQGAPRPRRRCWTSSIKVSRRIRDIRASRSIRISSGRKRGYERCGDCQNCERDRFCRGISSRVRVRAATTTQASSSGRVLPILKSRFRHGV
jgi:hypothetical protein